MLRKAGVVLPVKIADAPTRDVPVIHPTGTPGVLTGKQGYTRRSTLGHGICVIKFQTGFCERIDLRCFNSISSITTDPVLT